MVRLLAVIFCLLTGPASVFAGDTPPEGRWTVVSGVQLGEKLIAVTDKDDPYIGKTIRFSRHGVDGPLLFNCHDAEFAWSFMPAEWFFQGFAETAEKATVNAGLLRLPNPARTLSMTCETGIFDFHMRDESTMLIMINWVVYALERQLIREKWR